MTYSIEEMFENIKYFMNPIALIYYNELAIESIDFKIYFRKGTRCQNKMLNIINNMTNTEFTIAFATKNVTIEFDIYGEKVDS